MKQDNELWALNLQLDKEDDGGPWLIVYTPSGLDVVLRLRIGVGGPHDWYSFSAEVQAGGTESVVVGTFDIAPIEIFPPNALRHDPSEEPWDPADEPGFLGIPVAYQTPFAAMVRWWGCLAGMVVPNPATHPERRPEPR